MKGNNGRALWTLAFLLVAAFCVGQFKVDPQKIPIVHAKRRALIIGAGNYEFLGRLNYSSSDAKRFRDALISGFQFSQDSIKFLSDSEEGAPKPTSKNILDALDALIEDPILDRGDLFILYFSGHGMGTPDGDYLCATDSKADDVETTGLPVSTVIQKLVDAKLQNVLIIADACRAGEKNEFGGALYELAKKANIAVLLGCEPGKKSYESSVIHSGVFTYFLLKSMSNPKVRTESGGLWASNIAKDLSNSVYEFTQHDYGDNAQRPKSFADPTSDVLLAKFIDKVSSQNLSAGQDPDLKQLQNPIKVAHELVAASEPLFGENRYSEILELTKQALSLDSSNMFACYYASIASSIMGRNGEHEKFCERMRQSDDPYFRNLGYVMSGSRATPVAQRLKALQEFWESSPKDAINALIVWGQARTFLPLSDTRTVLKAVLADGTFEARIKSFLEGEIAVAESKYEVALAKYRVALTQPSESGYLKDTELKILQMPILRLLNRDAELKAMLKKEFESDTVSPSIWVTAAANLKEMGNRDAAVAIIQKGIKEPNLSEEEILLAARIIGSKIVTIVDDLDAQEKANPYSWRVRLAALMARGIKTKDAEATQKAFVEASRYCDDNMEIFAQAYQIQESVIEDAKTYDGVPPEQFAEVYDLYRIMYVNNIAGIGLDTEKWYQVGDLGLNCAKGVETLRLFRHYLKDFDSLPPMNPEFYTMLFQLAIAGEDEALMNYATNHPLLIEPDKTDLRLIEAAYYAMKGNNSKSKELFSSFKKSSEVYNLLQKCLVAIYASSKGHVDPLKEFLKTDFNETEANLMARGVAAIVLAQLGDEADAMPHLKEVSAYTLNMMGCLPARCMAQFILALKHSGQSDEADEVLFNASLVIQSAPGVQDSYFGRKPTIDSYAGSIKADTHWASDEMADPSNPSHKKVYLLIALGDGHLELTITPDGRATGFAQIVDGDRIDFQGSVDALGNLSGETTYGGHHGRIEAKLTSKEFRSCKAFQESQLGQVIKFYNEEGILTQWFFPAKVLSPAA